MSDVHSSSATQDGARVSVVVTAIEAGDALASLLDELSAQAAPLDAELVLVWNGAESALEALAPRLRAERLRVVFEARAGKSHALNRAVRECSGTILAFTDDDALPRPGWLERLTAPLLEDADLTGAGGPVDPILPPPPHPPWLDAALGSGPTGFTGPRHRLPPGSEGYAYADRDGQAPLGCNCAYRRDVLLDHPWRTDLAPMPIT